MGSLELLTECPPWDLNPSDLLGLGLYILVLRHPWAQKYAIWKSQKQHCIWLAHRMSNAKNRIEHVFFVETAEKYPFRGKLSRLDNTHVLVGVRTGPDQLGFPMKRTRCLAAGINRAMMVWCGPDPQSVEADFHHKFKRALSLTGSIYFTASDDEVFDYACAMRCSLRKGSFRQSRTLISERNRHGKYYIVFPLGGYTSLECC